MPKRRFLNLLLILFYTLGCNAYVTKNGHSINCGGENGAPRITPCLEFIILQYKSSYNVSCEAEEPVTWWSIHKIFWNIFEKSNNSASLSLDVVSADDVGAYYCIKKSGLKKYLEIDEEMLVENLNLELASSIYIYVNDTRKKLVPHQPVVIFGLYDNLLIPCKPSMPDTKVQLKAENITLSSYTDKSNQTIPTYNPMRGFELKNGRLQNGSQLICLPQDPFKENLDESIIYTAKTRVGFKQMDRPIIRSNFGHYVEKGFDVTLTCEQTASLKANFGMDWSMPLYAKKSLHTETGYSSYNLNMTYQLWKSELSIKSAHPIDSGAYQCIVKDNNISTSATYHVKVLEPNEVFLNITEPELNNLDHLNCYPGQVIWINASFSAYPRPSIHWYKPNGREIWPSEPHFEIFYEKSSTSLRIDVQQDDGGAYVLLVDNIFQNVSRQYNVTVRHEPKLIAPPSEIYVQEGSTFKLEYYVRAVRPARVSFEFRTCTLMPRWPNCQNVSTNLPYVTRPGAGQGEVTYEVTYLPASPGILTIFANTTVDEKYVTADSRILLSDLDSDMNITLLPPNRQPYKHDNINLTCGALEYHFNNNLLWFRDGQKMNNSNRVKIINLNGTFSYKSTLQFLDIGDNDRGNYTCRAFHIDISKEYQERNFSLTIHNTPPPEWQRPNTSETSQMARMLNESLILECSFRAITPYRVQWFKDDKELTERNQTRVLISDSKLSIQRLLLRDQGVYKCRVENRGGMIEKSVEVVITDPSSWWLGWGRILILLIAVIFLACPALCCFRAHKRRVALNATKSEEFVVLYEHLPPVFKIPRDTLKLGKQLGEGAFGVVLKGEAKGIRRDESTTNVAVKMAKRSADKKVMDAFMAELKIMIQLGQHVNVVNLLGAVTNNIDKNELMVILEYSRFENIHNILLKNRSDFVNQINPQTDLIDPSYHIDTLIDNDTDSHDEATTYTPIWGSNYENDSTKPIKITTSDLVSWAFQVARGMEYLSFKKVLHGDLAARNILLCENNVVKICDFGLSRSLYQNYYKKGSGKLPIKWLALESLSDHVFSTYSDVWSYGIVLWEMFSLAKVPYPGIDPNGLFHMLINGYRMEKPPYSNQEIYEIMLLCWRKIPESRPSFNELVRRFSEILGEEITTNNLELAKMQPTDYQALLGSPNEAAPSLPHCSQ
ncbi:uncharacterized protein Dana_GF15271, isoform B [Drosophila ananassae]|uniref:Uncharacterized protein, isoform B n=1 Tax=Drosophila ananassae TaxID=7217 RepID=B3MPH4_DROAN|nr:vascular endothelial growth factor receptor 3 isoform X2 [Drosophila ananassae]EDV31270.2 uncharacterized protein Dana_GF15271, isoform B [Drosophila ananassae]